MVKEGIVARGDRVIITKGNLAGVGGGTSVMEVVQVTDLLPELEADGE